MKTGKVTLVGAGPGGRDLLTCKGAAVLAQAEAVVFDRLVSENILNLIPCMAERIDVGKRNNHHPVPQDEINAILVRLAQQGKQVVRLKGGDCFLFGRGGEECEHLLAQGVPFEVVPGVTSALAVPAYAGIPVTHRDFGSSVHIITAHARSGKELHIDFDSLVRLDGTLVFLMGLTALEQVINGLLDAGLAPDMPAAVIENGTRGNQRKVVKPAAELADAVRAAGLQSPALIVVGRVCALSDRLDWFTPLPLHGKTVVVTRPRDRAGTLSDRLHALGAHVIEAPCIETVERTVNPQLRDALAQRWDWVVLTSPAGVAAMQHALVRAGTDMRALYGCKFAVIGAGTARELAQIGIHADLVPDIYDTVHLVQGLTQTATRGERVLLLRAAQGNAELPQALDAAGMVCQDVATYDTVYRSEKAKMLRELLKNGQADAVTFTSTSTVEGFVRAVGRADFTRFTALCIGQQTANAAKAYGMHVKIAKSATIDALIAALWEEL